MSGEGRRATVSRYDWRAPWRGPAVPTAQLGRRGGVEGGEPPRAAAQRSQTDRDRQHRVSSLRVESEEKHKTKLTEQNGLVVPTGGWAGRNGGGA